MATPPDSPYEDFMMTFEPPRPVKHAKPARLEDLCKLTKFTSKEIRIMYRGFKQECPEGVVLEENFKEIYAKFFPHGNSSIYAHHIFKAFDLNSNGQISFRDLLISLSQLLKGSVYDKLQWTFQLYDVNGDGCITKPELLEIVSSVHELMGRQTDVKSSNAADLDFPNEPTRDGNNLELQQLSPSDPKSAKFRNGNQFGANWAQSDRNQGAELAGTSRDLTLNPALLSEQLVFERSLLIDDRQTKEHVDRLFKKFDLNSDGVITIDEFIQSCMQDEGIRESLKVFEGI